MSPPAAVMDEVREAAREKSRLWITARELGSAVLPDMDGDIQLAPPVVILEPPLTVRWMGTLRWCRLL